MYRLVSAMQDALKAKAETVHAHCTTERAKSHAYEGLHPGLEASPRLLVETVALRQQLTSLPA